MKKLLLIIWLFTFYGCSKCQVYGYLWSNQHPIDTTPVLPKSLLHDLLSPTVGTLIIRDTQTISGWNRSWAAETTMFYDSATSNTKIYFTGGSDSIGTDAMNNKVGMTTTSDFVNYSTPVRSFGQGVSGETFFTRASASWVGKIGARYFALALNGYNSAYPGQDQCIYGYTSNDGLAWTAKGMKMNKATAWSGGALIGLGNTGVCVDQYNNPKVIGGKYIALVDAWNGSAWVVYKAQADSLMGSWTFTDTLTSLKHPSNSTYGSSQLIYYNGLYFCFYLYGAGGAAPSRLLYATSSDIINWTIKEAPFMSIETSPFPNTDQIADVNFCEVNGKVYMLANYCQNSPHFKAEVRLWTYNGTFAQMVSQLNL